MVNLTVASAVAIQSYCLALEALGGDRSHGEELQRKRDSKGSPSTMDRARTRKQRPANLNSPRRRVESLQTPQEHSQHVDDEFARFFAQSLDLLCIAGLDGYFKYLNPAWTACLGWTLEELKARPFLDFVHPDDCAATRVEVGKLAEGAETILFENRSRHQDG